VALTPDDSGIECKTSQEESEAEGEPRLVRGSSSTASQLSLAGSIASSSNNAARLDLMKRWDKIAFEKQPNSKGENGRDPNSFLVRVFNSKL
jgi:hypothetical protein